MQLSTGNRELRADLRASLVMLGLWASLASAQGPPWAVGHRSITFVDPARNNRSIPTEIYYPADVGGDNVPVAEPVGGGFPVVAFGHGYLMVWSSYENIWAGLVPHGYVAALPRTEGGFGPDHLELGLDLAFLISQMRLENTAPASPFYGALDSAAAVAGHSMGGGAAVLGAASDSTITILANLAAAETDPSAVDAAQTVSCPSLVISASLDGVAPPSDHQIPIYAALSSPCKTFLSITGGSHCQFAESNFYCELGEIWAPEPEIDRPTQHALTMAFLLPWFDYHLRDDAQAWYAFENLLSVGAGITYVHGCDVVAPAPPLVIGVSRNSPMVTLLWRSSPFADAYRVYSSATAYQEGGVWTAEGTTQDTTWTGQSVEANRFFRVTALKGFTPWDLVFP